MRCSYAFIWKPTPLKLTNLYASYSFASLNAKRIQVIRETACLGDITNSFMHCNLKAELFIFQFGIRAFTHLYGPCMMQIKHQSPQWRDAAVLPIGISPAAFGRPCPAIPGKPPRITEWGVVGTCFFRYKNNEYDLLIWPKTADSFRIEYIQ